MRVGSCPMMDGGRNPKLRECAFRAGVCAFGHAHELRPFYNNAETRIIPVEFFIFSIKKQIRA